jgi:hypothetical protein
MVVPWKTRLNSPRWSSLDLGGNIRAVVGQPLFLLMEHLNGLLNELIGRPVRTAFHVLMDQSFQFGS